MANVRYEFGGKVVEITSGMSVSDVNDALSDSNQIVLIRGVTYTGDIDFSGSNVALFGEGSGAVALGNAGMAPLPAPSGGC